MAEPEPITLYFGPAYCRKPWETQVGTPIGLHCLWCDDEIGDNDMGVMQTVIERDLSGLSDDLRHTMRPIHYECSIRSVVGSLGHQQKRCSCYGGTDEDPPGMTMHEAARAAEDFHRHTHNI